MEKQPERFDFVRLEKLLPAAGDLLRACRAASHALRSYQHGNASPDLARDVADACDAAIARAEGR